MRDAKKRCTAQIFDCNIENEHNESSFFDDTAIDKKRTERRLFRRLSRAIAKRNGFIRLALVYSTLILFSAIPTLLLLFSGKSEGRKGSFLTVAALLMSFIVCVTGAVKAVSFARLARIGNGVAKGLESKILELSDKHE